MAAHSTPHARGLSATPGPVLDPPTAPPWPHGPCRALLVTLVSTMAHSPTSMNGASPTPSVTKVPATMADALLPFGTQAQGVRRTLSAILVLTVAHSTTSPHRANPTPPASLVPAAMTDAPLGTHRPRYTLPATLVSSVMLSTDSSHVHNRSPSTDLGLAVLGLTASYIQNPSQALTILGCTQNHDGHSRP